MRLAYYALAIFCFSTSVDAQTTSNVFVCKNVETPTFSELTIQGPVNVVINTSQINASAPSLQIFGDPKTASIVTWEVKNKILTLGTKWDYRPHRSDYLTIKVNITPAQLKQISFYSNGSLLGRGLTGSLSLVSKGNGSIKLYNNKLNLKSLYTQGQSNIELYHINSTNLIIKGENDGKIKIEGEAAIQTINLTGTGNVMIYWVNTPYLKINASGTENIFLAGVAKTLDVQLTQESRLLAKQLRADNGFVKTRNQALAEITTINQLNALAKNNSVIYYSKTVNFINSFTQNSGLILAQHD
ncbi:MAG: DUF2807 domain-containing protein [Rickettsiella sp.]|nr:DUF2807 domain-containing protein [Rickettsiella sp.]